MSAASFRRHSEWMFSPLMESRQSSCRTTMSARREKVCSAVCTFKHRRMLKASWCDARVAQFSTSRLIFARARRPMDTMFQLSCRRRIGTQLWVPPGFAHGYLTLEDDCEVIYKVTDYYAPDCDRGIAWDDPALEIDWRISAADVILSDKDRKQPRLSDVSPAFQFTSRE